jgi:hypothetical protein
MRIFLIIFTLAIAAWGTWTLNREVPAEGFNLAGKVEVSPRLLKAAQANNVSCSIVIKNEADVPVAIKRIINPQFPLDFSMDKDDLLIEGYQGNLKAEVQINSHGKLGVLQSGDIFNENNISCVSGQKDIVLVADKMMGKPTLAGARNRGNFFRTAAR